MKKQDLLRLPELSVTERMKELVNEDIPTKKKRYKDITGVRIQERYMKDTSTTEQQ